MIKKLNESVKLPKNPRLSEMSSKQLKHLGKLARYHLNEKSVGKLREAREDHPDSNRVGNAPDLEGLDRAMSMVSDAHRTNELLHERDEDFIKRYPKAAYYYATRVMRDRWREAEETLRSDPQFWKQYKLFVRGLPEKKQRWNMTESRKNKIILRESLNVKGRLIQELEPLLTKIKEIQTSLTQHAVVRRMKALGGDRKEHYDDLVESVNTAVKKLEKMVTEFHEEGYHEGQ